MDRGLYRFMRSYIPFEGRKGKPARLDGRLIATSLVFWCDVSMFDIDKYNDWGGLVMCSEGPIEAK